MDSDRFDNLSRDLSAALPRQLVVRALAWLGAAGLTALAGHGLAGPWTVADPLAKKRRRRKKRTKRCPGKHDRVCHCAPGNTGNCHVTGDGAGHRNDPLDCCCTRRGHTNPRCSCDGSSCCKQEGLSCANNGQCCSGGTCVQIINGIGVCTDRSDCLPLTCADFPGQCGEQDDGCGGQTANCTCPNPIDTCVGGVCIAPTCVPLTCADLPDQCGAFPDGCDDEIDCACVSGGCCDGICTGEDACCQANDCPRQLCQVRTCNNGACAYTAVPDGDPGAFCLTQDRFCCNGEECCEAGDVCTGDGCCTPLICAQDFPGQCGEFADGCGGTLSCTCDGGQCCSEICLTDDQCCAVGDCAEQVCQTVDCVGNDCVYTPVGDDEPGPICTGNNEFCCNGNACCEGGEICFDFGCCQPLTQDEACAGSNVDCGMVSDGCGATYNCGGCLAPDSCIAGACLPAGGKRCRGRGLAGQPCKGKKCKCTGGRRCHNGKCCETVGDGSRHCNANSDCCPGLTCVRKELDQHKVCLKKPAFARSVAPPADSQLEGSRNHIFPFSESS